VRWSQDGAQIELTQKSYYPYDSHVAIAVETSKVVNFALNLRIPAWASGATVAVNGKVQTAGAGSFLSLEREWKKDDRIDLELPMTTRLEAVDSQHPKTVALMIGPLVLFAITDTEPTVTRAQLLAAKKVGAKSWELETTGGAMRMLPWTEIEEEPYTTYLKVA